ncbi:MAG: hypothetical protein CM1200mP26_09920 [Acidimicrobiales bacterium]|nr:MAG: hypothetical protein CM1200mP26_09920 [Acidimicrobiales bacterium]
MTGRRRLTSQVVDQLRFGSTAESGIWPVTRIGQCLIEGVPAECCAFDAHRELHHARRASKSPGPRDRAVPVPDSARAPPGPVLVDRHHFLELSQYVPGLVDGLPSTAVDIMDADDWLMEQP